MFCTSVAKVLPSKLSTLTSCTSIDLITNSESFVRMNPSRASLKAQFVELIVPSKRNLGTVFYAVEVSRLSGVIAKFLGTSFLPILGSMPEPVIAQ